MLMLKDGITIIKGLCQQNEKNKSCFVFFTSLFYLKCTVVTRKTGQAKNSFWGVKRTLCFHFVLNKCYLHNKRVYYFDNSLFPWWKIS